MYVIRFDDGQEFEIKGFTLIGRNPDKDVMPNADLIAVQDSTKTMSKTHAALAISQEGKLLIEDLESTNGTFFQGESDFETVVQNGNPLEIVPGTRVRLGDVYFTCTLLPRT
jgi:pSer/pThr/pTyr-binding forkhead associated (FHA) protein